MALCGYKNRRGTVYLLRNVRKDGTGKPFGQRNVAIVQPRIWLNIRIRGIIYGKYYTEFGIKSMKITNLQVNRLFEPLGISTLNPVFSFKVEGKGYGEIKSARIDVATDETFKNIVFSETSSDISPNAFRLPYDFSGGIKYFWRVTVVNDKDENASGQSFFECGRKNSEWDIPFITTATENTESTAFYCKFTAKSAVNARLYITALGLYEAYINGKKVGDEYFTPYCDDYRYILQYQTYDISEYLCDGENEIAVLCGNGWHGGRYPTNGVNGIGAFGKGFILSAEIVSDGNTVLTTDEKWKEIQSPVIFSEIYDGEIYDARKEIFDKNGKVYAEIILKANKTKFTEKPKAKIISRISPRVTAKERYKATLIKTPNGETVLDFGKEITGWVEISDFLTRGEKLTLTYGEILQNGNFYRDNLRTAKSTYCYTSDGDNRLIRPHFTFFGFRYVKVEGAKIDKKTLDNFVGVSVRSDMAQTGRIETSNEKLNRFIENVFNSQKDNFLDIPMDCPQRDERFGWTGDAQVFSETALFNADCAAFYSKYLENMRQEQLRYGGSCPFVVPDCFYAREELYDGAKPVENNDFMLGRTSAGWGDASVIIPRNLYKFTGDKEELKKNYPNMKLWTEFLLLSDENRGGKRIRDYGFQFGDWLALDNPDPSDKHGLTDTGFIATAYYYNAAALTAKAAKIVGEEQEGEKYERLAAEILAAINKKYVSGNGIIANDTQTAYALAIEFGLADVKSAGKRLNEKIAENGYKLSTGFIGTAFLLGALTKAGYAKTAYTLLLREELPSWLYAVNMGATTVWERWDSILPNGSIRAGEMNSLNHYAYGAVVSWAYKSIIGINQEETASGFKRAILSPVFDERLKKVYGEYDSVYGKYAVGYEIGETEASVKIAVPYLCEAKFYAPKGYKIKSADDAPAEQNIKSMIFKGGEHHIILAREKR